MVLKSPVAAGDVVAWHHEGSEHLTIIHLDARLQSTPIRTMGTWYLDVNSIGIYV